MTRTQAMKWLFVPTMVLAGAVMIALPGEAGYLRQTAPSCQVIAGDGASQHMAPAVTDNTGTQTGDIGTISSYWAGTGPVFSRILCALPSSDLQPASAWWGLGVHTMNPWDDAAHAVKFRDCVMFHDTYGGYCGPRWEVVGSGFHATGVYIGPSNSNRAWYDYPTGWPYLYVAIPEAQNRIDTVEESVFRGMEVWN